MGSINTGSDLLNLPTELLDNVLSFLDPYELARFGQSCKSAAAAAAAAAVAPENQVLWRYAFLKLFDDPVEAWSVMLPTARAANALTEAEWDWFLRLRNRCVTLKTLTTTDEMYRQSNLHRSTDVLVEIMETALYRASNAK
jgi:hypothetical protein